MPNSAKDRCNFGSGGAGAAVAPETRKRRQSAVERPSASARARTARDFVCLRSCLNECAPYYRLVNGKKKLALFEAEWQVSLCGFISPLSAASTVSMREARVLAKQFGFQGVDVVRVPPGAQGPMNIGQLLKVVASPYRSIRRGSIVAVSKHLLAGDETVVVTKRNQTKPYFFRREELEFGRFGVGSHG